MRFVSLTKIDSFILISVIRVSNVSFLKEISVTIYSFVNGTIQGQELSRAVALLARVFSART